MKVFHVRFKAVDTDCETLRLYSIGVCAGSVMEAKAIAANDLAGRGFTRVDIISAYSVGSPNGWTYGQTLLYGIE